MRSVRPVNGSDGSGASQATSGKRATRASSNEIRGFGDEELSKLAEQLVIDRLCWGERVQERDVGGDAALGRPVVLRAPLRDQRLGLGDDDDERGFRHPGDSTLAA